MSRRFVSAVNGGSRYSAPRKPVETQTRAVKLNSFTVSQATNLGNGRFRFVASSPTPDRHGTRVHASGIRLEAFKKNPVFLWLHERSDPDYVLGIVTDVYVRGDNLIAEAEFITERPDGSRRDLAWRAKQDVMAGLIRAVSIGFREIKTQPGPDGIIDILESELIEISLVPIGSNAEALKQ